MLLLDSARYLKKDLFSKGIITIGDLLSDARIFLKGVKALNANLSPIEYFSLMSIVDAIPFEQAVWLHSCKVIFIAQSTLYIILSYCFLAFFLYHSFIIYLL